MVSSHLKERRGGASYGQAPSCGRKSVDTLVVRACGAGAAAGGLGVESIMNRKYTLKVAMATAALAALGTAVYAQDKYSLTSPGGIAFSDFRGYEDWAMVSSARTDEVLKVIVANPTMIEAYK